MVGSVGSRSLCICMSFMSVRSTSSSIDHEGHHERRRRPCPGWLYWQSGLGRRRRINLSTHTGTHPHAYAHTYGTATTVAPSASQMADGSPSVALNRSERPPTPGWPPLTSALFEGVRRVSKRRNPTPTACLSESCTLSTCCWTCCYCTSSVPCRASDSSLTFMTL